MTTNLAPIPDSEWPDELAHMRGGFATRLDVYRVMAHHPALLAAWENLRAHVVTVPSFGAELSEIVILRTGHNLNSDYEWSHHVVRARRIGMDDARIASMRGPLENMSTDDAAIAGAVDALFDHGRLSREAAGAVIGLVGKEGLLDLMATVGFYSTLGFIVNTFETPVDDDVAAELASRPLRP